MEYPSYACSGSPAASKTQDHIQSISKSRSDAHPRKNSDGSHRSRVMPSKARRLRLRQHAKVSPELTRNPCAKYNSNFLQVCVALHETDGQTPFVRLPQVRPVVNIECGEIHAWCEVACQADIEEVRLCIWCAMREMP